MGASRYECMIVKEETQCSYIKTRESVRHNLAQEKPQEKCGFLVRVWVWDVECYIVWPDRKYNSYKSADTLEIYGIQSRI